jgi:hypothetical protein
MAAGFSVGSPLSTQASGDVMMTCDLSVDTPLSTLAGGAGRMRRVTFLFEGQPFMVLVPPPTEFSRSLGVADGSALTASIYLE